MVLKEKIDEEMLHKLIHSDLLKLKWNKMVDKLYPDEETFLKKYALMVKDGIVCNFYTKPDGNIGRCNCECSLSLLSIRREIRQTITQNTMIDIDISACHQVLMCQMLKQHGFYSETLHDYIYNRQTCFQEVSDFYELEKQFDVVKNLYLMITYGGTVNSWKKDNNTVCEKENVPEKLQAFLNDMVKIHDLFMKENKELTEIVTIIKSHKNDVNNKTKANVIKSRDHINHQRK